MIDDEAHIPIGRATVERCADFDHSEINRVVVAMSKKIGASGALTVEELRALRHMTLMRLMQTHDEDTLLVVLRMLDIEIGHVRKGAVMIETNAKRKSRAKPEASAKAETAAPPVDFNP